MFHAPKSAQSPVSPADAIEASDYDRKVEQLLQILADLDFALEIEVEKLERREEDEAVAAGRLEALKATHHQRRIPYIQRLAELHTDTVGVSAARRAGLFRAVA